MTFASKYMSVLLYGHSSDACQDSIIVREVVSTFIANDYKDIYQLAV